MIKPDGVQRGLIGDILKRFEQKGFQLLAAKLMTPSREHMEKHYADLAGKGFFKGMIDYMMTGPVFCMVWAGDGAVVTGRKMLGATKPSESSLAVSSVSLSTRSKPMRWSKAAKSSASCKLLSSGVMAV